MTAIADISRVMATLDRRAEQTPRRLGVWKGRMLSGVLLFAATSLDFAAKMRM